MNISVLQWNIWYKEKIENICELLKQTKADVVCLQELTIGYQTHSDTLAYIAAELGYHYFGNKPIALKGESWKLFNGIISKFPLAKTNSIWINEPDGSGGYDDEYRAYVEATIQIGNQHLTIATTHMSYIDRFEASDRKKKETDRLVNILKEKATNFIVTGDFNAPPEGYTIQKVKKYLKNAGPEFTEKTWTTKPFSYNGFEENDLNWRLDYVFATPDVKINNSRILKTGYSDHLPILVNLSLD